WPTGGSATIPLMQMEIKTSTLIGVTIILVIIAGVLLALSNLAQEKRLQAITTFDECAASGYPIMESFPEQCMTPDGRSFTNTAQEPTEDISFNGCAVAGCSGQLCVSVDEANDTETTCEYRAEYACYREALCEPQVGGLCGWTETEELQQCLADPPAL
ncbi:MAG TPA: hypothetical protein VJB97_02355, partial [Candidatus Paceibacterota bacterium]